MFRLVVLSALVALAVCGTEMRTKPNPHQLKASKAEVIEVDGKNYTFGLTNENWYTSEIACSDLGQRLLTLDTRVKADFWYEYLFNNPDLDMWTWIGARREAGADEFIWTTTNEPFNANETKWGVGQPDTSNTYPQCVNFAGFASGWEDDNCGVFALSYICEDIPSTTPTPPTA